METKMLQIASADLQNENEEIEIIGINTICRLCATNNERLIGIFAEEGVSNDLSNKINLYLPIKVGVNDELPLQCCWNCASTLLAWHELVVTSVEVDRKFRSSHIIPQKQGNEAEELDNAANTSISDDNDGLDKFEGNIMALYRQIMKQRDEANQPCHENVDIDLPPTQREEPMNFDLPLPDSPTEPEEQRPTVDLPPQKPSTELEEQSLVISSTDAIESVPQQQPVVSSTDTNQNVLVVRQPPSLICRLQCEICDKEFKTESTYAMHVKSHVADYFCKFCCNSYITKRELSSHQTIHRPDAPICEVACTMKNCNQKFPSKLQLYCHKTDHIDINFLPCEVCGMAFWKEEALEKHLNNTHQKFKCKDCKQGFFSRKNLAIHRKEKHHAERRNCKLCSRFFHSAADLQLHQNVHKQEKHKCKVCGQFFSKICLLDVHLKDHQEQEKPKCQYCSKKFKLDEALQKHLKQMHIKCQVCDVVIGGVKQLKEHQWKEHDIY